MDLYNELKSGDLCIKFPMKKERKNILNKKGASFYAGFDPSARRVCRRESADNSYDEKGGGTKQRV